MHTSNPKGMQSSSVMIVEECLETNQRNEATSYHIQNICPLFGGKYVVMVFQKSPTSSRRLKGAHELNGGGLRRGAFGLRIQCGRCLDPSLQRWGPREGRAEQSAAVLKPSGAGMGPGVIPRERPVQRAQLRLPCSISGSAGLSGPAAPTV